MAVSWTHITIPVADIDGSIGFFTSVCGLSVVRDRRLEGGTTVWLGPEPETGADPTFVLVIHQGHVREPLDHFGFQCAAVTKWWPSLTEPKRLAHWWRGRLT